MTLLHYINIATSLAAACYLIYTLFTKACAWQIKLGLVGYLIISIRGVLISMNDLNLIRLFNNGMLPTTFALATVSFCIPIFFYIHLMFLIQPDRSTKKDGLLLVTVLPAVFLLASLFFIHDKMVYASHEDPMSILIQLIPSYQWILVYWMTISWIIIVLVGFRLFQKYRYWFADAENRYRFISAIIIYSVFTLFIFIVTLELLVFSVWQEKLGLYDKLLITRPFLLFGLVLLALKFPSYLYPNLLDAEDLKIERDNWDLTGFDVRTKMPNSRYATYSGVKEMLDRIDAFVLEGRVFRRQNYGLHNLSVDLEIPVGHLRFLFKEYSKNTFTEYRNMARVRDFESILNDQKYRKKFTLDAMGKMVGFGSQSSFARSVKQYTNKTPAALLEQFRKD